MPRSADALHCTTGQTDACGWGRLADGTVSDLSASPIRGWRYWGAAGGVPVQGKRRDAVLFAPLETFGSEPEIITDPRLSAATCRRPGAPHPVPAPDCSCGFRLVRDLPDLLTYIRAMHPRTLLPFPSGEQWLAVTQVEARGLACTGRTDPPNTARVDRITIVGPLYLAPPVAHAAPAFRRRFGVPVVAGQGHFSKWINADLPAAANG